MAEKEPSQRQLRVGQEIKRIIAALVDRGEVRNLQEIDTLITITEARISPDLKYCNVFFICTDVAKMKDVEKALQLASGYFRKQVAGKTELRYVPQIVFRVDDTFERVDEIEKLLRNPVVAQDLSKDDNEE